MKKVLAVACAFLFVAATGCKKNDTVKQNEILATKYAKFRASVYKDKKLDKKSWMTILEKGEPVGLLEEETVKNEKNQIEKISKIKLSDDTIGYISTDFLALKPVVFIANNVTAYERNNINSTKIAVIPAGTLAFVTEEKADWTKVDIGPVGGKNVIDKWVNGGISDSPELVADAVSLEKARNVLSDTVKGDKQEALNLLRTIAEKNNAIGQIAKAEVTKIDGSTPATDGTAQNSQQQQPQQQQPQQ